MSEPMKKNLATPDEVRTFPKGKLELVTLGGLVCGKGTLEPGWKWSEHIKPIAKTASCMVHHQGYVLSGTMRVRMDDGTEAEFGPGDAMVCPPGHDAWIVGDEPFVGLDFGSAADFARRG